MSDRIKSDWIVLLSIEAREGDRCVDIFVRPDGTFGFEEFRRDSEDMGKWTGINYFSAMSFDTKVHAFAEAKVRVVWLDSICESKYASSENG